jgi:hypothetical protein
MIIYQDVINPTGICRLAFADSVLALILLEALAA